MLLGRSLFGLSVEIINICVFAQIVYWFQGKLYNFAYASTVATARLGMVTVMLIGPMLTKNYAVKNCYLLGEKLGFPVSCGIDGFQNQTVIANLAEIAFVNGTVVENGYVSAKMQITIMYAITCAIMLSGVAATMVMFVITPPFKTFKEKETVSIKTKYSSRTLRIKSKLKSTFTSIKKTAIQCAFTIPCWLVMATARSKICVQLRSLVIFGDFQNNFRPKNRNFQK